MQTQAAQVINWIAQVSIPLFSGLHADLFDLYNERTSLCLNPFVFRASCRRIGICLAARVQVSQSLCFQGFMQTSARSRTAHGPAGLNPFVFRASCRQTERTKMKNLSSLNPFVFRASCRRCCLVGRSRLVFLSQSLCFQGFMQTLFTGDSMTKVTSQSLCFQGFMQTNTCGRKVGRKHVSIPLFSGLHADGRG